MIDKIRIETEAEQFFEWPTKDHTFVTRTSMLIFASVIAEMVRAEDREACANDAVHLDQYKKGHDALLHKVAWLEKQLDCVQTILAEIDKKCGSGFLPWEIEDAYAEYQRLIDVGPDNASGKPTDAAGGRSA
jgi:hypothetical protein